MQDHLQHSGWIPYLIPLLAIFIPSAITWVRDLNAQARRMRRLEEYTKLVEFWDVWAKAATSSLPQSISEGDKYAPVIDRVLRLGMTRLYQTGHDVHEMYNTDRDIILRKYTFTHKQFCKYKSALSLLRRAFLIYRPANKQSARLHIMFHLALIMPIIEVLIMVIWPRPEINDSPISSALRPFLTVPHHWYFVILVAGLVGLCALLVRMLRSIWLAVQRSEDNPDYYLWEEDPDNKYGYRPRYHVL